MSSRWSSVKIDSLRATARYSLVGGPFGSNLTTRDYVDDGVPVIRGTNLPDEREFEDDGFVFVADDKANSLASNLAYPGDIVFTQRGTLGQVGIIPESARFPRYVISQSQMKLTVNEILANSRFVYYFFRHPNTVQEIKNRSITSGVPHINLGVLKDFNIPLPPLYIQDEIVKILSAYDDLIENNRRRMALLEESARLLYREWFVRLRFPGYEHTPIVDGVPQGWEQVPTPNAIEINPKIKLSDDEEHWFVEMANLPTDSMVIQGAAMRDGRSGPKFQNGDTLLARITPCLENGKTGFVDFMAVGEAGRGSTEFIVLRSKRVTPEFVYCLTRTYEFRGNAIKSMIGSSGRQRVQESCFEKFMVYVPPHSLLRHFSEFASPAFVQIKNLAGQNQKLRAARDLLLPRLMSGELAV
jgi:type I restriction enzyme S subunit